jgi:O-methyltransferase involved in polyketide biosynthesis
MLLESQQPGGPEVERISFTAKLVAHARQFTDIPYARDVAELIDTRSVMSELASKSGVSARALRWAVPYLEARYKSILSALQRSGVKQVLELASGVALRGLVVTADPTWMYVETDLPGLTGEKRTMLAILEERYGFGARPNLYVVDADARSWSDLEEALGPLDPNQPVAIVNEGLLPYLSHAEKNAVAANVARILGRAGGVWITPDLSPLSFLDPHSPVFEHFEPMLREVEARTGRAFTHAAFESQAQVDEFAARNGFTLEILPQIDGSYELSSVESLHVDAQTVADLTRRLELTELRLAPH